MPFGENSFTLAVRRRKPVAARVKSDDSRGGSESRVESRAMPPYYSTTETSGGAVAGERRVPARIETLDVLRGVAICGILLMNIWKMGGVTALPLRHFPPRLDAEWVTWGIQSLFVDGAMRGLFTLLFGASMLLMLRRAEGAGGSVAPVDAWVRRSLGLMALGLFQWLVLQWPGEILWDYGVAGLFLLSLRTARVRTLLIVAGLLIAALTVNTTYRGWQEGDQLHAAPAAAAALAAGRPVDAEGRAAIAAAAEDHATNHPTQADRAAAIAQRRSLPGLLKWAEHFWMGENIGLSGWLEVMESVSFMAIGMALLRMGVLTGEARASTYRWMMIVGYGGGVALRALLVGAAVRTGWDMSSPLVGTGAWTVALAVFQPARLLVTMGHVGLVVTLWQAGAFGRGTTIRALGRMTLTVYCLQSAIASVLFYGFGFVGAWSLPVLWLVAAAIWAATALFCRLWLARFAMGPAERLLRSFAYGELGKRSLPAA
jgi:uncharacterized protein